jgi:hypothetical protein
LTDIPGSIDLNSEPGAVLTVEVVGGIQVEKKIKNNPSCFHVWGTTSKSGLAVNRLLI